MIKCLSALAASGLTLALGALAAQAQGGSAYPAAQPGRLTSRDYKFLVQAAHIDPGEVKLGELAQKAIPR